MQADFRTHVAHVERAQDPALGDAHGMELAIEFRLPEFQELAQDRIFRVEIVFLPDESLQQFRMIGHVIENFSRRQSVAFQQQSLRFDWHTSSSPKPPHKPNKGSSKPAH